MELNRIITLRDMPNTNNMLRVIGQQVSEAELTVSTGVETIVKTFIISPGNWDLGESFLLDFTGFYTATPLTTVQFRVRLVGNNGAGPPNNIIAEFTHSPGANFSNIIRGSVLMGRPEDSNDTVRTTFQIVSGNAIAANVNAAILGGYLNSFTQNMVIQLNMLIVGTNPIAQYINTVFYKLPNKG